MCANSTRHSKSAPAACRVRSSVSMASVLPLAISRCSRLRPWYRNDNCKGDTARKLNRRRYLMMVRTCTGQAPTEPCVRERVRYQNTLGVASLSTRTLGFPGLSAMVHAAFRRCTDEALACAHATIACRTSKLDPGCIHTPTLSMHSWRDACADGDTTAVCTTAVSTSARNHSNEYAF